MNDVFIKKSDLADIIAKYFTQDLVSVDDLICLIESLVDEIYTLNEKIEDLQNDIEDNYVRVSVGSQVDISDRDFI